MRLFTVTEVNGEEESGRGKECRKDKVIEASLIMNVKSESAKYNIMD